MSFLKMPQGPEWAQYILQQMAEDTLAKTRVYNADADVWRLLRPEDLGVATLPAGGVAEKQYYFVVTIPPATATVVIRFRVPTGIGITFYGVSVVNDLGTGAVYELHVNTVKRQELWLNMFIPRKGGSWVTRTEIGVAIPIHPVHAVSMEQLVFTRQNDLVEIHFYCKHGWTGQLEFFPLAVIAGNRKQLLVAE